MISIPMLVGPSRACLHLAAGSMCRPSLPEEEEEKTPPTRMAAFRRKLSELWSQVAGI
jgi:hypothetical protein